MELAPGFHRLWVWGDYKCSRLGRDRGGGCSPSPRAATPNGDTPTVHCTGRLWKRTLHGFPPATPGHCPRPSWAGEERREPGGVGVSGVLESGRDRGGGRPPPRRPLPRGDTPTVHCMGRLWRRTEFRLASGARLSPGYRHALLSLWRVQKPALATKIASQPDPPDIDLLRRPGIDRLPCRKRRDGRRDACSEVRLLALHERQEFLGKPLLLGEPPPLP